MREIKFRAWHKDDVVMVYFKNDKLVADHYQMSHFAHLMRGDYGDVLMQFTGLKDCEDNDIYEGDIISIDRDDGNPIEIREIKYYNAGFNIDGYQAFIGKVIGNIHENKELLQC